MKTILFLLGAGIASAWMINTMKNKSSDMLSLAGSNDSNIANSGKGTDLQRSAVQRRGDLDTHSSVAKRTGSTKESSTGNVD